MRLFVQRNPRSILALLAILLSLIAPAPRQTAVGSGRPGGGHQGGAKKTVSAVTIGARLSRYTTRRATTAHAACEATVHLTVIVTYRGRATWARGQTLTFAPGRDLHLPVTPVTGKKTPKGAPTSLRLAVPRPKHGRSSLDLAVLLTIASTHGTGSSHARTEIGGQAQLLLGRKSLSRVTLRLRAALSCAAARKPAPSKMPDTAGSPGSTTQVRIVNFAFSPAAITVTAGTTVVWTNDDTAAHTVTAADGSWTSPSLAKGVRYSRAFTTPGTYNYICAIHPYMKGTVIVTRPAGETATAVASVAPSSPTTQPTPVGPQPAPATPVTLPGATTAAVTIAHFAFTPQTLTVPAGTPVIWTNQDAVAHTVTADDGSWDSGNLAQGASYTRRFDTPGTYTYKCAIHPYMTGTIVVMAPPGVPQPTPPPPAPTATSTATAPPTPTSPPPPPGATATPTQVVPLNASVSIVSQSAGFSPKVVTIQVGGTVTWTNTDGISHTVTADDGSWSSSVLGPGATYSYTFNTPGAYNYMCAIHPSMTGTVIVVTPPGSTATSTSTATGTPTATDTAVGALPPSNTPTAPLPTTTATGTVVASSATSMPSTTPPAPTATSTPQPSSTAMASVTIANLAFAPQMLTVPAGTSVTWTNQDSFAHTVTADDGSWDSGNLAQGASYTRRFDTPGTYTYHCAIHPFMKGTIVVTVVSGASPTPAATSSSTSTPTPTTSSATSMPTVTSPSSTSTSSATPVPPTSTSSPPPGATATPTQVVPLNASVSIVSQSAGFNPKVITIQVGGTVTWTNTDGISHTVTADDGSWSSSVLGPGATYSYTFNTPGAYNYMCAIHPSMTGTVIVVTPPGSTATSTSTATGTPTATSTHAPPTATNTATATPSVSVTAAASATKTPTSVPSPTSTPITVTVVITGFAFKPQAITVTVGTTIRWINARQGVPHTSTSDTPGLWDSGILNPGQSYARQFTTVGTFAYHCNVHPFMKATVTVIAHRSTAARSSAITAPRTPIPRRIDAGKSG